jgi:hypothetical protein
LDNDGHCTKVAPKGIAEMMPNFRVEEKASLPTAFPGSGISLQTKLYQSALPVRARRFESFFTLFKLPPWDVFSSLTEGVHEVDMHFAMYFIQAGKPMHINFKGSQLIGE